MLPRCEYHSSDDSTEFKPMPFEPNFGTLVTDGGALEAPGWDTPFRVGIFADFSGRGSNAEDPETIASRKAKKVDREIFDEVLASYDIRLSLDLDGKTVEFPLANIDDFHPDQIIANVEAFEDCDGKEEKSELLSKILHHPDFQNLERTWRGLDWFLRRAWKSDNGVETVLYDLTQAELETCLNASDEMSETVLFQWLVEKAMKGFSAQPWAVLLGQYSFAPTGQNAQTLGRLSKIARHAAAPFLSSVEGPVWEKKYAIDPEDAPAWKALRELPEAMMIGLATPGFLQRLPYGSGTKPVDKFDYEEFSDPETDKAGYLFGNPAFACGALLAKSFTKKNWQFKPGADLDLADMNLHVYRQDGDEEVTLASAWLDRPASDRCTKQGFMPILCVKGANAMQLLKFLSISIGTKEAPEAELVGSWGQKSLKGVPRRSTKAPMGPTMTTEAAASGATGSASKMNQMPDDLDEMDAQIKELEAERKAAQEAKERAESGDSGSSDMGMDFGSSDDLSSLSSDSSSDSPSPEMDPELAALLGDSGGGSTEETPSADMDPELAALLAGTDSSSSDTSSSDMDPELAALLAGTSDSETPAEEPAMDPELAALLGSMEETPASEEPAAEAPAEDMDPELAALLKGLETEAPPPEEEKPKKKKKT